MYRYRLELYTHFAVPKRQTSITGNYDEQLQCTVRTLSRDHKTYMHCAVAVDFKQSTSHRKNGGRRRIHAFAEKKQEELSRDQTSTVIAFITLEVTAR